MHKTHRPLMVYLNGIMLLGLMAMLTSCFKEDTPVVLPPPGESKVFGINMGEDYHRQAYFQFFTEDTVGSEFSKWDLCFESSDTGWRVWMNGGNNAFISNTHTEDFNAVTSTTGLKWEMDDPEWNMDSTAIGDWRIGETVYIIDRGSSFPDPERYRKMVFLSVSSTAYEIRFAELNGMGEVKFQVPKKPGNHFVYFSFDQSGLMRDTEPGAKEWELLFTHYRTVITTVFPPQAYLVTGVLINPLVNVAVDSTMNFEDIDYSIALSLHYSTKRDIVGYTWKRYDFASQAYVVKPFINYIVKDATDVYWKLRFIDFYDSAGLKGHPQFEFQRL